MFSEGFVSVWLHLFKHAEVSMSLCVSPQKCLVEGDENVQGNPLITASLKGYYVTETFLNPRLQSYNSLW